MTSSPPPEGTTSTRFCPNCDTEKATADARFCVVCGYPLGQPCPYGCGEWVGLRDGEEPRLVCPRCARPYHVCKNCGRLYTNAVARCETRKCDGYPVAPPLIAWTGRGATAGRTFAALSPVRLLTNRDARSVATIALPRNELFGGVAYAGGRLLVAQGHQIRAYETDGAELPSLVLDGRIPEDAWRVAASHARMFCVHASEVSVVDLPTWVRQRRFPGTYRDQVLAGQRWYGIRVESDATVLEERDEDGQPVREPTVLPIAAAHQRAFAADAGVAWVGFADGSAFRIENGARRLVGTSDSGYAVEHIALTPSYALLLERGPGGCRLRTLSPAGDSLRTTALGVQAPLSTFAVVGGLAVVADTASGTLDVIDLASGLPKARRQIPGATGVVALAGIEDPSGPKLMAAAVSGNKRPIYLLDLLAEGGGVRTISEYMQGYDLGLLVADGRLVLTASSRWENLIETYDASDA